MARLKYTVTAPDGEVLHLIKSDFVTHTKAVIGLMRLRTILTDKERTEGATPHRFKKWIFIGTAEDQRSAEWLVQHQGYAHVTEETRIFDVVPERIVGERPGARGMEDDDGTGTEIEREDALV